MDSKKKIRTIMLLMVFAALLLMVALNPILIPKSIILVITPLTPLFIGIIIAMFLNVPLSFFENVVFRFWKGKKGYKFCRPISLLLTFILIFGIITGLIVLMFPSIRDSITEITTNAGKYVEDLRAFLIRWNIPSDFLPKVTETGLAGIITFIQAILGVEEGSSNILSQVVSYASSIFSLTFTAIIGLIFSIYILLQKDRVIYFFARLFHAILPEKIYRKCTEVFRFSAYTVSNFISGQLLHAILFGTMILIIMLIAGLEYPALISILTAILSLVPYVGAFLSAAIAVILLLTVDPFHAILFLILYLIAQQIDDHIIYPKFIGTSTGIPGLIVLLAVTVGSAIGGVVGMVFGVPIFAIGYHYIHEFIDYRLSKKEILIKENDILDHGDMHSSDSEQTDTQKKE